MPDAVDVLNLISIKCDLRVPQPLDLGYVRDVEEKTKSIVIFEANVDVTLCELEEK